MVDPYGNLSPLPEKCPTRCGEIIEDSSEWHTKDGADKGERADQIVSESGFADKFIGKSILTEKQSQPPHDGDWSSGLLSHPFDKNSASISFFNVVVKTPKRPKLSFVESPSIEGQYNFNFQLESIEEEEPRRAICLPGYEPSVDTNKCSFFDYVLRAHKNCIQNPFSMARYFLNLISSDLKFNNSDYWSKRGSVQRVRISDDNLFSTWYNNVSSYIMDNPHVKDYVVDHIVVTSMLATYLACKKKTHGVVLCAGIFSLYWYRTGRNVLKDNVFTQLLGRLEKLLNDTRHQYCNYFGFGDEGDGSDATFQVSDMYKFLDLDTIKAKSSSLFSFEAGDDSKPGWHKIVQGIEGFYKQLNELKLIPLLLGMTGVVAVSGFCAITGRDYADISDFEVSEYLDVKEKNDFQYLGCH